MTPPFATALLDVLGNVPATSEPESDRPAERARSIASLAAAKAAATAGGLALPPGPLGRVTVLPEMVAVWRIQAQMVADIAGTYGAKASLSREQMLYCLFRHTAAQAVRDLAVRVGERLVLRPTSLRIMESVVRKIGVRVTERAIGKGLARWLPVIGALVSRAMPCTTRAMSQRRRSNSSNRTWSRNSSWRP